MNTALVDQIANAVLYEGYLLYPYRPSVKNRQRWTFGGLYPRAYSEAQEGTDPWFSQTECLIEASENATLGVRVRFLHLQTRTEKRAGPPSDPTDPLYPEAWQEAVEREVILSDLDLVALGKRPQTHPFAFDGQRSEETNPGVSGEPAGKLIREQSAIAGTIEVSAERVAERLFKLTVRIANQTAFEGCDATTRDDALLRSLVSTHAILEIRDGLFVSLTDPPEACREIAARCSNVGTWPVLVGEAGDRHTLLASPIILSDYPQIAPESPGDLFDATEIDEILTLRILTMTDDEKRAMASIDERARALLQRTEAVAREQLMGLHGTIRGLKPIHEG